jgi:hypothetical protein
MKYPGAPPPPRAEASLLTPERGASLALIAGTLMATLGVVSFWAAPYGLHDFSVFYREGLAWIQGVPLYSGNYRLNLNPPLLTVTLFAPLARLSYTGAKIVWLMLDGVSIALSLWVIRRELRLTQTCSATVLGALLATQGSFMATRSGQITWLLLAPLTLAWAYYRGDRPIAAGVCVGICVAIKPPLALMALLLPWQTWTTAGAISAGLSLAAIAATGLEPWLTWARLGSEVTWLGSPANASLWGAAARLRSGGVSGAIHELSLAATTMVCALALILGWITLRQTQRDRRFLLASLWSLLVSPLGWAYYLPLVWGPVVALWGSRPIRIAYLIALFPVAFNPPGLSLMPVSIFLVAVLCAWIMVIDTAQAGTSLSPYDVS